LGNALRHSLLFSCIPQKFLFLTKNYLDTLPIAIRVQQLKSLVTMGKQQSFEDHYDLIKHLYIVEDKTLLEVMDVMKRRGFDKRYRGPGYSTCRLVEAFR